MAIVTEKKIVKISGCAHRNPVFVTWLSTLGREQWLFDINQTEALETVDGGTFEPSIEDLETSRGQILDLDIMATPQLIVYALLDNEDIQGVKTIMYSRTVEMLMNPSTWTVDGPKWQRIRPRKGSFKIIDTNEVRSQLTITFDLPYINGQQR